MISIYVHIPFCVRKCKYCDFLSFKADSAVEDAYIDALLKEIERTECKERLVRSIYIGGGTPSTLSGEKIGKILSKIKTKFNLLPNCEISMECNPGTASYEKLSDYREAGVNRLSIGLQSCNDNELKLLGRIHTYDQFVETFNLARKAGFDNINIDLMSALPGQSVESYKNSLTKVVNLNPEHISAYSLIIEEGTEFAVLYGDDTNVKNTEKLPNEDDERAMYYLTKEMLAANGYTRYEISNYSKEGYECRHNLVYWTGDDYISFGIGAASYVEGVRYSNTSDIECYIDHINNDDINGIHVDITPLSTKDKMEEFMIVGLRLMKGVSSASFANLFGQDIEAVYGMQLNALIKNGLIRRTDMGFTLTERGIDVSNQVLEEFLL